MISVCITTYNGSRYVAEQIESVARQLSDGDEIIVCDDHSTDDTLNVVRALPYKQIRIIENADNVGYTANFERALRQARGEFVFLCDQDDVWVEDKVERCMKAMQTADFVVTDAIVTDADGNVTSPSYFSLRKPYKSLFGNVYKFSYIGCCCCFRRRVLERALPFPRNHRLCTHDNWLFLVGRAFYKVAFLPEPLIRYRRHKKNTSAGYVTTRTSIGFMLRYRAYLVRHLLRRAFRSC